MQKLPVRMRSDIVETMLADEARRLIDEAMAHESAGKHDEASHIYRSIVSELERKPEYRSELSDAYAGLLVTLSMQGRRARVMRIYRDYLAECAPRHAPPFDEIYCDALLATGDLPAPFERRERFHTLATLLERVLPLRGTVAECGCLRGLSSYILCRHMKLHDESFDGTGYQIFDSFQGLSVPQREDEIPDNYPDAARLRAMCVPGYFSAPLEAVKEALRMFPGIEYFAGWIPASFPQHSKTTYRFVHIDVDLYQPIRDSLEYFYPRLATGGIIVCDDYNWPGGRKAIEEFCAARNLEFKTSAHRQAYIVKDA